MIEEKKYWIGFNLVRGIGSVRFKQILSYFGDLSHAWDAPAESFLKAGLPDRALQNFLQLRKQIDLDQYVDSIFDKGISVLTLLDQDYPRLLKEIDQSPPVLYIKGTLTPADELAVAMVGTRRVSAYGQQVTRDTSTYLAGNGLTIVSGLARGVDALAHQHALQAGGRTIAVDRLHQCPVIGVHELRGKVTNLNDHVLDQAALIRRRVGQNIPDYRVPVPRVPHADAEAPEVRAAERGLDVL